jgi:hypothetical protein
METEHRRARTDWRARSVAAYYADRPAPASGEQMGTWRTKAVIEVIDEGSLPTKYQTFVHGEPSEGQAGAEPKATLWCAQGVKTPLTRRARVSVLPAHAVKFCDVYLAQ